MHIVKIKPVPLHGDPPQESRWSKLKPQLIPLPKDRVGRIRMLFAANGDFVIKDGHLVKISAHAATPIVDI
jgi:hypothetical protein